MVMGPFTGPDRNPESYPEARCRALQTEVRAMLTGLVAQRDRGEADGGVTRLEGLSIHLSTPPESRHRDRSMLMLGGSSVRSLFLLMLALLLNRESSSRIRRCPEAACGHLLFYRVRRQRYCSPTCVTRANKRAYRMRDRGKVKERARQRAKYERRVRRTHPNPKIARRQRRRLEGGF